MGRELGSQPTGRDVGCGIVAFVAGAIASLSVIGGAIALVANGPSFRLLVGFVFNLMFWYWIAVGAWRRTVWSAPLRSNPDPRC